MASSCDPPENIVLVVGGFWRVFIFFQEIISARAYKLPSYSFNVEKNSLPGSRKSIQKSLN